MAKKEHRVKVTIRTVHFHHEQLVSLVQDFQEILKEYPDAWIEYESYGHDGGYDMHVCGTRKENSQERAARLASAKKEREAAKKAKEAKQLKELEMLAKLKAKYEKE